MKPAALKMARQTLGLSQNDFAADLGMSDGRTIRRWEAGSQPIPGSVQIVVNYWLLDLSRKRQRLTANQS